MKEKEKEKEVERRRREGESEAPSWNTCPSLRPRQPLQKDLASLARILWLLKVRGRCQSAHILMIKKGEGERRRSRGLGGGKVRERRAITYRAILGQ